MRLRRCEKCNKIVQSTNYERHFTYCGATEFKCTKCEKKYKHLPSLYKHERIHEVQDKAQSIQRQGKYRTILPKPIVHDSAPNAETTQNNALTAQIPVKDSVPNVQIYMRDSPLIAQTTNCSKCGKTIPKTKFKKHFMCCFAGKYKCLVCEKVFNHRSSLCRHEHNHKVAIALGQDIPLALAPMHEMASIEFSPMQNGELTAQTLKDNAMNAKTIDCSKCGKTISKTNFERHDMCCYGGKSKCRICKKIFNHISSLCKHEHKHIASDEESASSSDLDENMEVLSIEIDIQPVTVDDIENDFIEEYSPFEELEENVGVQSEEVEAEILEPIVQIEENVEGSQTCVIS